MIRRCLKWGSAAALRRTGGHLLLGRLAGARPRVLVLGYHRVVPDFDAAARHAIPAMLVSVSMLERQLDWVGRTHRFVTLDEAAAAQAPGAPRPARPLAAVTFDDGYADVHEHARPLLARKGIPGAAFVASDLLGTPGILAHDVLYALLRRALEGNRPPRETLRLVSQRMGFPSVATARALLSGNPLATLRAALCTMPMAGVGRLARALEDEIGPPDLGPDPPRPMTWEMVSQLRAQGFLIGSHTRSHPFLTVETPARVAEELRGSRDRLQRHLREPVRHFAYPDGRYDRSIAAAAADAGYTSAWGVCAHRDPDRPHLTLPRRLLWEKSCQDPSGRFSGHVMDCWMAGAFDLLAPCRMNHEDGSPVSIRATVT
jgi:peptidoglycan/xylan/chitin deacetylase (PgdA/CDA1 family)